MLRQCELAAIWRGVGLGLPDAEELHEWKSIPLRTIGFNAKHRVCHRVSEATPMIPEP
jgi:hypothetical protein